MPEATVAHNRVSKRRRILTRLTAMVLSFAAACAIGEAALRIGGYHRSYVNPIQSFHQFDETLGHRGKPDFQGRFHHREFDVIVEHDENGFRRQQHQHPRSPGRPAVFVFGDSFTWGWGVGQGKVFTDQMSLRMPNCHVRNYGLSGSGTVQQFRVFQAYAEQDLRPGDVVLVAFFRNDFSDNVYGRLPAAIEDGRVVVERPHKPWGHHLKNSLKDYSCLFNLAAYCVDRLKLERQQARAENPIKKGRPLPEHGPQWQITRHFLAQFQQACRQKRVRLVLAYIPGQAELEEASTDVQQRLQFDRVHRRAFLRCVESLGIETVDLLPQLLAAKRAERCQRLTFATDEHWNENGHAAAGEILARHVLGKEQHGLAVR